jgi:hypothetical protein
MTNILLCTDEFGSYPQAESGRFELLCKKSMVLVKIWLFLKVWKMAAPEARRETDFW